MKTKFEKTNNACLVILAVFAVTVALHYTRTIVIPFILATFGYIMVVPLINMLIKMRLGRFFSKLLALLLMFFVVGVFILLISVSFNRFSDYYSENSEQIEVSFTGVVESLKDVGLPLEGEFWEKSLSQVPFLNIIKDIGSLGVQFISSTLLIVLIVFFLVFGHNERKHYSLLLNKIMASISHYLVVKLCLSLVTGILAGLILFGFNIKFFITLGLLSVFLNFIPNIGSIMATLLPIPVILFEYGLDWRLPVVLVCLSAVQVTIGNVIEPKILGDKLDLHPVCILLFLLFWGLVWGVPGLFLAVPITATVKIILSQIEATKPWAEALAGRFPQD